MNESKILQELGIPASEGSPSGTFSQLPDGSIFITYLENKYKIFSDGRVDASLAKNSLNQSQIDKLAGFAQKLDYYEGSFLIDGSDPKVVKLAPKSKTQLSFQSTSTLMGIPCAPGIAEGVAFKDILILKDFSELRSFKEVKGIIIEKGSLLSHLAITARELGIPCVMNVRNISVVIKHGTMVQLNGNTGVVTVLEI